MTVTQMTVDALASAWSRILLRPAPPAATVIVAAGAPAAALLPLDQAAAVADGRSVELPTWTAEQSQDVLLDLIYRAQRLGAPTGITRHRGTGIAVVPLSWLTADATEQAAPAPIREETAR
ncbi:hypothetical protein ABZX88_34460 [Kitasatospora aureofaciens]|uniref:hypothetical protein n=1 Tax=Kitasatospora aureofaciens TaxID=1894 RepID=UPI0033BF1F99